MQAKLKTLLPVWEEKLSDRSCKVTISKSATFEVRMTGFARRMRRNLLAGFVFVFASAALLSLSATAWAQTGQGIISGIVSDSSGASIPKATVAIRNTDTGVVINVTTNGTGYYEIRDLNPGNYEVSVTVAGFDKTVHSGIVLLADGHPSVDMALKVGKSDQTVVVYGDNPLIDTQSVGVGQVLTSEEMSALPNGQAAIWLAMLSPGVQSNYAQNYQLGGADPSWNGAGPQFGSYGRIGANEFSLDGAPNVGNQRGQALNLSPEETGQTSVNITQFDAAVGHTFGIYITQTTKAGTNDLHGGIRYRRYDLRQFGMQHFQRTQFLYHLGLDNCSANPQSAACQKDQANFGWPGTHLNFGDASIGGPVFIPKLFDGRNRLFFFVGVELEAPNNANSNTYTVPTAQQKKGDFTDLNPAPGPQSAAVAPYFAKAGCPNAPFYGQYQIYNRYSAYVDSKGVTRRLPFCGNVIPQSMISTLPLVQIVNSALPDPDTPTSPGSFSQNYLYEPAAYNTYREVTNRYDYAATGSDHFFFRWTRGHYSKTTQQFLTNNLAGQYEDRWITSGTLGWSKILSSTTVVDATVGATQYTGSGFHYPNLQKYKPSDLGMPTYLETYAGSFAQFPYISISTYQNIGNSYLGVLHYRTLALRANLTSIHGTHTLRGGAEWRQQNVAGGGPQSSNNTGGPSGQFNFDNTYTRQNDGSDNTIPTTTTGLSYAAFLLGVHTTATTTLAPSTSRSNPYYSFYAGDTWRVTRKLTLTPGLRYEFEYGPTEKHNRQIVGWDPNAQLTFAPAVQAAYQATLSTVTAAQRAVLPATLPLQGGPIYAGVNGASLRQWESNWRLMPRLGVAYSITPKMVIRAGAGYFYDTLDTLNEVQTIDSDGFTSTTSANSSNVFGTDFVAGTSPLSDPFPSSGGARFAPAVGSSLGADYYAGSSATIGIYDHNRLPARSQRFQLSLERQFAGSTVVQVAYVASRTTNITLDGNNNGTRTYTSSYINATSVPASFFAGGQQPNTASNTLLGQNVLNPFNIANLSGLKTSDPVYYNVLSKSSYINAKNISIANLVRPYPQLAALRFYNSIGGSQFQELQANLSKRISRGLVANVAYQKNYQKDRDYFENPFDTHPSLESSPQSPPWRLTATWVYTLPFGRGQKFARGSWSSAIFGGFKYSGSFEANPGNLLTFAGNGSGSGNANVFYFGDMNNIRIKVNWVLNTAAATPTVYGFNAQSVTAVPSTPVNGAYSCTYTGTGFVTSTSVASGLPSCYPTNYNLRVFPIHVEGVRAQGLANWNMNLGRTFNPNERFKVEGRVDLLPAFNHQRLAAVGGGQMNTTDSRFGQVTSDNGNGREIILQMLMTY